MQWIYKFFCGLISFDSRYTALSTSTLASWVWKLLTLIHRCGVQCTCMHIYMCVCILIWKWFPKISSVMEWKTFFFNFILITVEDRQPLFTELCSSRAQVSQVTYFRLLATFISLLSWVKAFKSWLPRISYKRAFRHLAMILRAQLWFIKKFIGKLIQRNLHVKWVIQLKCKVTRTVSSTNYN